MTISHSRLVATVVVAAAVIASRPLAAQPAPDTEIFLAPLRVTDGVATIGAPVNVTNRPGYDNQPAFTRDGRAILYTSQRGGQTDIYRYDLRSRETAQVTDTPESEYSPSMTPDGRSIAVVRVEQDSTQRLWRFALRGRAEPRVLLPEVHPVGYYVWADQRTLALFVLGAQGEANTLQLARLGGARTDTVLHGAGRSLHRIPGSSQVSVIHTAAVPRMIIAIDPATQSVRPIVAPLEGGADFAWASADLLLMARGTTLFQHAASGAGAWREVADLAAPGIGRITRLAVSPRGDWLAFVAEPADVAPTAPPAAPDTGVAARHSDVAYAIGVLAADSLMGRLSGTPGIHKAARFLAGQFAAVGLRPAGDSTGAPYLQRVPLQWAPQDSGPARLRLAPSWASFDTVPAGRRLVDANVIGLLPGSDPAVKDEVVVVTAHYDHVGVGPAVNGDSIYNGADDDASGTVALIEIARQLARGPAPRRTVIFAAMTGEERGLLGTNWYLDHPVVPLARTVANLNVEMIGRPDSLAGGAGKAWLTGYERSTMGDMLKANGIPIVADPRPAQNFFMRSDNIAFAIRGIPAHTISSFGLHTDYHQPSDEAATIDVPHMTAVIEATAQAVRQLADGAKPEWHPGGRP